MVSPRRSWSWRALCNRFVGLLVKGFMVNWPVTTVYIIILNNMTHENGSEDEYSEDFRSLIWRHTQVETSIHLYQPPRENRQCFQVYAPLASGSAIIQCCRECRVVNALISTSLLTSEYCCRKSCLNRRHVWDIEGTKDPSTPQSTTTKVRWSKDLLSCAFILCLCLVDLSWNVSCWSMQIFHVVARISLL